MQSTETEPEKRPASVNPESIKFRPSPNFKHMKKYLKYKFEETTATQFSKTHDEKEKAKISHEKPVVQARQEVAATPPLPPPARQPPPAAPVCQAQPSLPTAYQPPPPPPSSYQTPPMTPSRTPSMTPSMTPPVYQPPPPPPSSYQSSQSAPTLQTSYISSFQPPPPPPSILPTILQSSLQPPPPPPSYQPPPLPPSHQQTAQSASLQPPPPPPSVKPPPPPPSVQPPPPPPSVKPAPLPTPVNPPLPPPTVPTVNPPLPPNPPPDEPIVIKEEIIDADEYQEYKSYQESVMKEQPKPVPDRHDRRTMCRNFVRGTCKKGEACIFAHEMILDQLPGVYTFCKNFQNNMCKHVRCKFVHATVFEKENFYRTGYLPPHVFAHLKVGPPSPPPSTPAQEKSAEGKKLGQYDLEVLAQLLASGVDISYLFPKGTDMDSYYGTGSTPMDIDPSDVAGSSMGTMPTASTRAKPSVSVGPSSSASYGSQPGTSYGSYPSTSYASPSTSYGTSGTNYGSSPSTSYGTSASTSYGTSPSTSYEPMPGTSSGPRSSLTAQLNREWEAFLKQSASAGFRIPDMDTDEPLAKKCSECDTNAFRYQYHKNKFERLIASHEEINRKMAHLNTKTQRLSNVLVTIAKPQAAPNFSGMNLDERDKAVLRQLSILLAAEQARPRSREEEALKKMMSGGGPAGL